MNSGLSINDLNYREGSFNFGLNIIYSLSRIQYAKHNNITRYLNEKDLTVSVSLYESFPERW